MTRLSTPTDDDCEQGGRLIAVRLACALVFVLTVALYPPDR